MHRVNDRVSAFGAACSEVQIGVIDIVRVEGGQIVEHWNVVDRLGLLQQLGALPAPALT